MKPRVLAVVIAMVACSDAFGPLNDGEPYALQAINGEPLPWFSPVTTNPVPITVGWIRVVDDTAAERHEERSDGNVFGSWTYRGRFERHWGMMTLDYGPTWNYGSAGPSRQIDTFYVHGTGLVLREGGYIAPLDTMTRYYARP